MARSKSAANGRLLVPDRSLYTPPLELAHPPPRETCYSRSAARARNSLSSPLTPLRCRAPAYDQANPSAESIASRADSATKTVPGRATPVTRLATLTGLLTAAMFALGTGVHVSIFKKVGVRPFVLAAASTAWVAVIALTGVLLANG